MNFRIVMGAGVLASIGAAAAYRLSAHKNAIGEAEAAYARLAAQAVPLGRFDPAQVLDMPEVAQRYFRHAIAPGTPFYTVAELEMEGTFLLGDKARFQTYKMSARQVLRPPDQFVWIPTMHSGVMTITGSDALVDGEAWTRFWLHRLLPVAKERSSPDLVRSAQFRAAVEGALWLPPSLLPENGVAWEQIAPHKARVTLCQFQPAIVLEVELDQTGAIKEVVGQRWSDANPDKVFRLQPFGGTISAEASFQGLTIPTEVAVGNHYGAAAYLPFFQAEVVHATYS